MNKPNTLLQRIQWEIDGLYEDNPTGLSPADELYVKELKKIVQSISTQQVQPLTTQVLIDRLDNEIKICKQDKSDWSIYLSSLYTRELIRLMSVQLNQQIESLTWKFWSDTGRWLNIPLLPTIPTIKHPD